jgi:hypothetical protein
MSRDQSQLSRRERQIVERARISALRRLVGTFFDGSAGAAAAALLDLSRDDLSEEELAQLQQMVDRARKEGR